MDNLRPSLKKRFGTPEAHPRLRIICETIGPGKARLLRLIAETSSISAAARHMAMSYPRAWHLIEAMNAVFRHPLVRSAPGGQRGGASMLTATGRRVLALYEAIAQESLASSSADLKRLHRLLKR